MQSQSTNTLKDVFLLFAQSKQELDNRQFLQLCKNTNLIDKKFTTTDVDILHSKYWDKSTKKLNFVNFQASLKDIAAKKAMTLEQVQQLVQSSTGPNFQGTKAGYNKFHDDKTQYTGVYKNGGPDTGSLGGKVGDLSNLCDRSDANVRGVKK